MRADRRIVGFPRRRLITIVGYSRSFDDRGAGISWGTVAWIKTERPGALAALCSDFATYRKKHRRGGRNPVEGLPTEEAQLDALTKHAGSEALNEISLFFREGRNKSRR